MRIPRKRQLIRRNPIAAGLRVPQYRAQVIRPRKGRGSYQRSDQPQETPR
jgi:stalled ribosome alternative rescue factor ArfA